MGDAKISIDSLNLEQVSAILLDVAGTTTAISFVKETLFPYVIKHAEEFLKNRWEDEEIKKAVSQFEEKDLDVAKAGEIVKTLTNEDDTNVGLKTIQGLLFKKGYEDGELKGHIFDDVAKCLESWAKTKKLAVFSSGSVESQKLLFKNTSEGDLTGHISNFFDQSFGPKTEADSYKKIAKELEINPENILFLTDDVKEAEAAKAANLLIALVEREGNAAIPEDQLHTFAVIKSFADIPLENVKRKIEEESVEEPPSKIAKTEESKIETETLEAETDIVKDEQKKKDSEEKCEEAMDVDGDEGKALEKEDDPEEKHKDETPAQEKTADSEISKPSTDIVEEEKKEKLSTESMEVCDTVVSTETTTTNEKEEEKSETSNKTDNQTESKSKIEIGTQTKTVTNECETQTTIKGITNNKDLEEATEKEKIKNESKKDEVAESKTEDKKCDSKEKTEEIIEKTSKESKPDEVMETTEEKECDTSKNMQNETKVETDKNETVAKCSNEATKMEEKKDETKESESNKVIEKNDSKETEVTEKVETKKETEKVEEIECKEIKESAVEKTVECKEKVQKEESESKEVKLDEKAVDKINENGDKVEMKESKEEKEVNNESKDTSIVVPKENGVSDEKPDKVNKTEEKENNSELANGKENGVTNGESSDNSNSVEEKKEEEIKVKVIDENKVDASAVSVEA